MADLAALALELAEAERRYAEAQEDVKHKRQKVKDERKAAKKQWVFAPFVVDVLLLLYYLANYEKPVAVAYAQGLAKKTKWPSRDDEEVTVLVSDLFLAADEEHFLDLISATEASSEEIKRARQIAVQFKADYDAAKWAKDNNVNKGVAPPSDAVLEHIVENRSTSEFHTAVASSEYLFNHTSTGRSYVCRWRQTWGGRYGGIRVVSDISQEVAQEKAAAFFA